MGLAHPKAKTKARSAKVVGRNIFNHELSTKQLIETSFYYDPWNNQMWRSWFLSLSCLWLFVLLRYDTFAVVIGYLFVMVVVILNFNECLISCCFPMANPDTFDFENSVWCLESFQFDLFSPDLESKFSSVTVRCQIWAVQ